MRLFALIVVTAFAMPSFSAPTLAKNVSRAKAKHTWQKPSPRPKRDCTPINGRFGYYGNPWCDTGSSRPPDIEFRERHRLQDR
jgi:hypothetical protein